MFKPIPEALYHELPFDPNEQALSKWLNEVPKQDDYVFCEAIFYVLQSLNHYEMEAALRIRLLDKLQPPLQLAANRLESTFLDSSFPLSATENNSVEILVWVYHELAQGYLKSIEKKLSKLKKRPSALSIYQSLSCLYQSFLYMCEVYARPYTGFWDLCYLLYANAELLKLQHLKIDNKNNSIQHVFNKILILELCGTNQFRSRHIKRLNETLQNYIEFAKINTEVEKKYIKSYCKFELNSDEPPKRMHSTGYTKGKSVRFITTVIIAKKIFKDLQQQTQSSTAQNSINQKLLLQVVNTLGMAKHRKNARVKKDISCTGVVGLGNLIYLLQKQITSAQETSVDNPEAENIDETLDDEFEVATELDPRVAGQWEVPDLELVPVGEEQAHQLSQTYKKKIWHNQKLDKLFSTSDSKAKENQATPQTPTPTVQQAETPEIGFESFNIQDSSAQGHRVLCKSNNVKVKTGDIIGIVPDFTGRIELGLIRRLDNPYDGGASLGVKVLSLETKLASIHKVGSPVQPIQVLFLPGTLSIQPKDCIIYDSAAYKTGDIITLNLSGNEKRVRLGKTLHTTASIAHTEVIPETD